MQKKKKKKKRQEKKRRAKDRVREIEREKKLRNFDLYFTLYIQFILFRL